jgi:cobalamin biosynthesis protein CobT
LPRGRARDSAPAEGGDTRESDEPGEGEESEAGDAGEPGDDLGDHEAKAKKSKGKSKDKSEKKDEKDAKGKPEKEKKEPKGDKADDKEDKDEKGDKKDDKKAGKKDDKKEKTAGDGDKTDADGKDEKSKGKGEGEGEDDEPAPEGDDLDLDDGDDEGEASGAGEKGKGGDKDDAEDGDAAGDADTDGAFDPSAVHEDEPMGTEPKEVEKAGGSPGFGDFSHDPTLAKEIEDSPPVEFDEAMAELISERAQREAKDSDYLIYTRDYDEVGELDVPAGFDDKNLRRMCEKVDHMVAPLQKDIERAIAARSQVIWTGGHRRGKLHSAALSRLRFGRDDVFRRKQESTSKDVAVELVVDQSGSMGMGRSGSGSKIQNAAYAAYAFSAVLDRMNIAHEVVSFTTTSMPIDAVHRAMEEQIKMKCRYGRLEAIWMPIIKPFNERLSVAAKRRFAYLAEGPEMCQNVDGESVQMAAMRLAQRRESRKILMVFSDGHPACPGDKDQLDSHLRQVVKEIVKRKIDVIGIGIQDTAVKSFYPKHVIINDVAELPGECMKQLKALLTR